MIRRENDQPDAVQVHAQFNRAEQQLRERFPTVADYLADARDDLLAFTAGAPTSSGSSPTGAA